MQPERGDVVRSSDPFKLGSDRQRPWLIVNNHSHPFDDEQFLAVAISTKRYDHSIPTFGMSAVCPTTRTSHHGRFTLPALKIWSRGKGGSRPRSSTLLSMRWKPILNEWYRRSEHHWLTYNGRDQRARTNLASGQGRFTHNYLRPVPVQFPDTGRHSRTASPTDHRSLAFLWRLSYSWAR